MANHATRANVGWIEEAGHILHVERVTKRYRNVVACDQVTATFGPGITALLGPNGAGKSTLSRIIVGIEQANSGHVRFNNNAEGAAPATKILAREQVGWLPQSFGFPKHMRVGEFVSYAAWLKGMVSPLNPATASAMERCEVSSLAARRLGTLSGGTLRRVGLAAAIVHSPPLLVLDEPTTGLDPLQRQRFHAMLDGLGSDTVVVLATHLMEDVAALAREVRVMDAGRLAWSGTTEELRDPSHDNVVEGLRAGFLSRLSSTS